MDKVKAYIIVFIAAVLAIASLIVWKFWLLDAVEGNPKLRIFGINVDARILLSINNICGELEVCFNFDCSNSFERVCHVFEHNLAEA